MQILKSTEELQIYRKNIQKKVGFVPTMGALHNGHLSLIDRAKKENDIVIVSIFVNPTQFLPGEDFESYPKKIEADIEICKRSGIDALFIPAINQIYSKDEPKVCAPKVLGYTLEGYHRPGHFDGVLSIVLKLFNLVKPHNAYFGKKDAQQLILIKKMTKVFFLDINIVECEIVREANGLALSSRNTYLSKEEKKKALNISKSLTNAAKLIRSGQKDVKLIKQEIQKHLKSLEVDYIAIVDRDLKEIDQIISGNSIILIAARVGKTRLIDNIWL